MYEQLVAPELVWGLIPRCVGVLYMIAFGALIPQLEGMIGTRGLGPIAPRLERARHDFPGLRRFHLFPTLLWISSSDRTLRLWPWLGVACGAVCVYGGPAAPWAHALGWVLWLSLEQAAMLIFPWDTMLLEIGFLALFLPTAQPLPSLLASSLPYPAVAFMVRFLVLRLMLGFGKVKFVGSKPQDALYLRGFFVWSSASPLALLAHHLPAWMLRGMLYFMFVGEVIAPLLGFFTGPLRLVSCALLVTLMMGIQLTGNWGFFNVGYILLCVCLLDTRSSIFDLGQEPWRSSLWHWPQVGVNAVMLVLFLTGLIYLIAFDSWTSRSVIRWPLDRFTWNRAWLRGLLAYLRAIGPFRLVNGYGVFPPHAQPPFRQMPVFEGSNDGVTWKAYRFRFNPSSAKERPPLVSPYHPRMDMAGAYACHCIYDGSLFGSLIGDGTPYSCYTRASWLDRLCQRLLEGEPLTLASMGHNPFPDAPPKLMRVAYVAMTAARPEVRRATGEWWHVRRCGIIIPPHGREAWPEGIALPDAEVLHPDWVDYKRVAAPIKALSAAFLGGLEPDHAILVDCDLTQEDVRGFWEEFLPCVNAARGDFSRRVEKAQELRERFGMERLARFERVLERYAWLLRLRTERHQFADAQPQLPIVSNFRYHMFLQELVMDGHAAYHAYLADVQLVVKRLEQSSDEKQLWTLTMLRHQLMVGHMAAFRWTMIGLDSFNMKVPGLFEYYPLLSSCAMPEEEYRPEVTMHPNGEHTVVGLYPPPGLAVSGAVETAV